MADIPFPDLTEACKMLLLLMVEKDIGEENGQNEPENDDDSRLSLRKRVARWGYYHGKRSYQEFFIKYILHDWTFNIGNRIKRTSRYKNMSTQISFQKNKIFHIIDHVFRGHQN